MVDEVNTNFDRVSYERDQIKKFLLQNGGVLPYPHIHGVLSWIRRPRYKKQLRVTEMRCLRSSTSIETALRTIRRSPEVSTARSNALQVSLSIHRTFPAPRARLKHRRARLKHREAKIVIWTQSGLAVILSGPGVEISDKDEAKLFGMVTLLSTELQRSASDALQRRSHGR